MWSSATLEQQLKTLGLISSIYEREAEYDKIFSEQEAPRGEKNNIGMLVKTAEKNMARDKKRNMTEWNPNQHS